MPKSHDVSKVISKVSERGGQWCGWGTALKPAHEPIVVARKPLRGTIADNVLTHGTGAMNIDGCRVPHGDDVDLSQVQRQSAQSAIYVGGAKPGDVIAMYKPGGRWPANVIHDGSDAAIDPLGSFARYFYCAKASRVDREDGCDGLPTAKRSGKMMHNGNNTSDTASPGFERFDPSPMRNHHPTVKPTELMRYLVRLATPPGGITLDPFCGSGSTGRGAVLEGMSFVGIDLSEEYIKIARLRIAAAERTAQIAPQQDPLL
jgi:site-specific DNA-methyltransferase (adenine-specific)